jgi:hypothetical protein
MTYYLVRLDTKEVFAESDEKPTDVQVLEHKNSFNADIMVIEGAVVINSEDLEGQTPAAVDTIQVRAVQKVALAKVVGHDKACKGQKPPGKPIMEPPKEGRVVIPAGNVFRVNAQAAYSCKDDPTTPEIMATGNKPYFQVAEGQPGAGQFCRKDKTAIEGS